MSRNAYLIIPEIQFAYSEHECVVCIVGCLLFWGVLIAVTFTWGLYLDLSMQSTGVSFLSTLHCRRSGLATFSFGKEHVTEP